jgi:hypothetical protein
VDYRLLLVDGHGQAVAVPLRIRTLREFPGLSGVSVHFRPVRADRLFESAKSAGELSYRILLGEGIVRAQLWVEYEVLGQTINVTGRSSDLLFAIALLTSKWKPEGMELPIVAATGVLDADGNVLSVDHTREKLAAAVEAVRSSARAVLFYPSADAAVVQDWRASLSVPAHIEMYPVSHVDEALTQLGYTLERVYLRNPFRGLEYFDYEHRAIFFGRDAEVRQVVEQLLRREANGTPGILVEGASGSGKSSFMRAGLLPVLVNATSQASDVQERLRARPIREGLHKVIWRVGYLPRTADEGQFATSILECWRARISGGNYPPPVVR